MTISSVSLVFDALLAGLLAVMIYYAVVLNRRIAMLRSREDELQEMFGRVAVSSVSAQEAASRLRAAGTEAEVGVKAAIAKAASARGDLDTAIEHAIALVDKIEMEIERQASISRSFDKISAPAAPARTAVSGAQGGPRAAMPRTSGVTPFTPRVHDAAREPAVNRIGPDAVEARTEAERQLLAAIRAAKEGAA
jgi:hypothetical protein